MAGGEDAFPLSYNQSSLWYLQQYAPTTSAYNVHLTARIRGPLDTQALTDAVARLVVRHPSLRTTFHSTPAGPVQRFEPHLAIPLAVGHAADVSDEELRGQVAAEFSRPYDLERGPCFRPHLWRRTADDHILMIAAHHTVMDLAAMTTLQDELWTVYRGLVDG
ncbi:MAG: condensation domain-containing protein, partial [Actinomycetota bacterium]|nr:condensation domain-containing protein [Actinomycetota bacterium]